MSGSATALSAIATPDWLHARLAEPGLLLFDASMPMAGAPPGTEQPLQVIPGARRFDYDQDICDPASPLPHTMPSAELFQAKLRALGLCAESTVVVYDNLGLYASPRAWWMLRAMGHDKTFVLDGGLPAWRAAGYEVDSAYAPPPPKPGDFVARPVANGFVDAAAVQAATEDPGCVLIDARSHSRFHGQEPEPRPGLRSGHIPGSCNLPFAQVLQGGHMKPVAELQQELKQLLGAQAEPERRLLTTCGSGVTACILTLAAYEAGYRNLSVYDGSWTEWGAASSGLPVAT